MTRFSSFTDDELDAMEKAICNLCNKRLTHLVDEVRKERKHRESKKVESGGYEMNEEELMFANDKLFVCTPLPQYGDGICAVQKVQLVMTKKIFQECYKKWIEPQESEDKE